MFVLTLSSQVVIRHLRDHCLLQRAGVGQLGLWTEQGKQYDHKVAVAPTALFRQAVNSSQLRNSLSAWFVQRLEHGNFSSEGEVEAGDSQGGGASMPKLCPSAAQWVCRSEQLEVL